MKLRIQGNNFGNEKIAKYELIKRRYHFAEHIHQYAELAIPIKGSLTVSSRDRTEKLSVGEAAFIFPFQPHRYESSEYNELAIFVFSPSLFPDVFNYSSVKKGENLVFIPKKTTVDIILKKVIESNNFELLNLKGALFLFISDYLCTAEIKSDTSKNYYHSVNIIRYIKDHITEKISLKEIANALGYTPNYVSTLIKSFFGDNLASLITALRTEMAIDLLCRTKKSCLEIAVECGFGCERSFFKQFKDIIGATPHKYRRSSVLLSDKSYDGIVVRFE